MVNFITGMLGGINLIDGITMKTILAFFGYVKIPKEAILLSMLVEEGYRRLSEKLPNSGCLTPY